MDQRRLAGFEIEKVKAGLQREHSTALLAQRHRPDFGGHVPGLQFGAVFRAAE